MLLSRMESNLNYIFTTIAVLLSFSLNAAELEVPSKKYPDQAIENFGWLHDYNELKPSIYVSDTAKKFITKETLTRYVKLKLRNFVSNLKVNENIVDSGFKYNYLSVSLELDKYNDKQKIYTGLLSFRVEASINRTNRVKLYKLTKSIAGSENQMLGFIKEDIDQMVEFFAEDYYYISDELEKHNKALKSDS